MARPATLPRPVNPEDFIRLREVGLRSTMPCTPRGLDHAVRCGLSDRHPDRTATSLGGKPPPAWTPGIAGFCSPAGGPRS